MQSPSNTYNSPTAPARANLAPSALTRVRPHKARQHRVLALGLLTLGALAASTLMLNLLSEKFSQRVDVTATGQQRLSPRTQQLLASLPGPTRLVIAANLQNADPRARQNLTDVLDEMVAAQPAFTRTLIDTSAASGAAQFRELLASLRERERPVLDANVAAIQSAISVGATTADSLREGAAKALDAAALADGAGTNVAARSLAQQAASLCRVRADELSEALARAREQIAPTANDSNAVPATDTAANLIAARFRDAAADLTVLARDLRARSQDAQVPAGLREAFATVASLLERARTDLTAQVEPLATLPRPDILRLSRALSQNEGAVLIGPPPAKSNSPSPLVAIEVQKLLPDSAWINEGEVARRDLRGRTEELLASGLASLLSPQRPIIIFLTPEDDPYLGDGPFFRMLQQRLASRGIDMLEWQVVKADAPDAEAFKTLDPENLRPRVYLLLGAETTAGTGKSGLSGPQVASKMGEILSELLAKGENVLISINPSIASAAGGTDAIAAAIAPLGIEAFTGTPLMTQVSTPQGIIIETDRVAQAIGTHPIASAVGTLPTYVSWATPMRVSGGAAAILSVPASSDTWGETEWTTARLRTRDQLAMMRDRPRFNEGRDRTTADVTWTIGAASERTVAGLPQRVIVVGSSAWFADPVTNQTVTVEGRPVLQFPGNLELFDASISWLARQDALIAQSPAASSVAMVRPMKPDELQRWRIGVIAGPAVFALLVGGVYWLRRR
jgi:hypothetical protein